MPPPTIVPAAANPDVIPAADKPTVLTFHDPWNFTGRCAYPQECEKWKTECVNCPHLRDYPSTLLFDHTRYMHRVKKETFENLFKTKRRKTIATNESAI